MSGVFCGLHKQCPVQANPGVRLRHRAIGFDQLQRAFRQFRRYVELLNLHAVCLARMVAGIDILDLRIDPKKHIIALGQVSSLVE